MTRWVPALAAGVLLVLIFAKFDRETGLSNLVRFGESWQERRHSSLQHLPLATASDSNGYDGQFYAQIALDPSLRDQELTHIIDLPQYRARRILLPAIAGAVGVGDPWWTIQVYAALNILCWFALAWLLRRVLPGNDPQSLARWFGCLFSMGVLESVRQSLVDLPALLLLVAAVQAHSKTRSARTSVWLALGNLAKETNLLATLALLVGRPVRPEIWRRGLLVGGCAVVPLAAWSLYVSHRLPSAIGTGMGNFSWPLVDLSSYVWTCWENLSSGNLDSRYSMGLFAVAGFIVQGWTIWSHPQPRSPWWRIGAAYSLLGLILGTWVWAGYWAACRALLPMTIAFNLLLPVAPRRFWPLWIAGNFVIVHAIWRFL